MLEPTRDGLDWHYSGVSPQLLARVRLNWSALGLDLDAVWRESIRSLPGFREIDGGVFRSDSRPIDLLLLFDQGFIWVDALRDVGTTLLAAGGDGKLTPDQVRGVVAITTRLRDELAAVRMLTIAGLAMPAMQISRSISEDVDLALALLVRRKLARAFIACQSPEDAADFWRRHVSGGRIFRLIAQTLYQFGLDHSEDSEYGRWRKEVLVFLGSAVHTSFQGRAAGRSGDRTCLNPAAQECLSFTTIRLQELCAYSLVLGRDLQADLGALTADGALSEMRLNLVRSGGEIIIDQMRWLTDVQHARARADSLH